MTAFPPRHGVCALVVALMLTSQQDVVPARQIAVELGGTARMVARLQLMAERIQENPSVDEVANSARIRVLEATPAPADPAGRGNQMAQLAQELVRAGRTQEGIDKLLELRALMAEAPDAFPPDYDLAIWDNLAIAYLRLAEEAGCIGGSTADGCTLPILSSGVQGPTEALNHAIEAFEHVLASSPDDLGNLWLLNLAHMMRGDYPEGVPESWRIPPESLASAYDIKPFRNVAARLGLAVVGHAGGSVSDDFDGDGFIDIMSSGRGFTDQLRFFRNVGDGTFEERTAAAGLNGLVRGLNMIQGDYDNDGFIDLFVLRGAWEVMGYPNSLLRNNGDGTFDDVTEAAGLLNPIPSQTAAFGDYDNDGDLDLFVGNESTTRAGVNPCQLFENNGDGTFTDVALRAGVDITGFVKAVAWGDYDNDGRQDLYVSVLRGRNYLFHNEGPDAQGRWGFLEVARRAGVIGPDDSFPIWFWDYDNDGWEDLFVSGYNGGVADWAAELLGREHEIEMPRLYRNNHDGTFTDVAARLGLHKLMLTMGSNFGDLDNDGWLDFYVGTGDPDLRTLIPNRMFRNDGGLRFQEVTASGRFGFLAKGHGVSFADFDHDGDQDLHVTLGAAYEGDVFQNALLLNPGHGNHWLTLRLEGRQSNRSAIGARIAVTIETEAGRRVIYRTVSSGGTFGASPLRREIGLGQARRIMQVEIFWPASGTAQRFLDVAMDHAFSVTEGESELRPLPYARVPLGEETSRR